MLEAADSLALSSVPANLLLIRPNQSNLRPVMVAAGQADGIQPRTIEVLQVRRRPPETNDNLSPPPYLELWASRTLAPRRKSDAYGRQFSPTRLVPPEPVMGIPQLTTCSRPDRLFTTRVRTVGSNVQVEHRMSRRLPQDILSRLVPFATSMQGYRDPPEPALMPRRPGYVTPRRH